MVIGISKKCLWLSLTVIATAVVVASVYAYRISLAGIDLQAVNVMELVLGLQEKSAGFDLFLLGAFLIMALYNLGLCGLHKQDKPSFYFGMFCLLMAVKTIATGELLISEELPEAGDLLPKIDHLAYCLSVPVGVKFIYHLYASGRTTVIVNSITASGLLCSGLVVLLPLKYCSRVIVWYDAITLLACLYVVSVLVSAVKASKAGAGVLTAGIFILLATVINHVLMSYGVIASVELIPLGLTVFVFSQALDLSIRFSQSYGELERISAELSSSNDRITHILESITDGFFALDKQSHFTYLNKEAERLWNKPQEQMLGKVIWDELSAAEKPLAYRLYRQMVAEKPLVNYEIFWTRSGKWLEMNAYPSETGLSVFVRDIQERKHAAKKIREYTSLLKEQVRMLELDPDYSIETDLYGVITFWNHGAELGYGWTKEEAMGQVIYKLLHTEFPKSFREISDELMTHGRWLGELVQTRRDGTKVVVKSCWLLKRGADDTPIGIMELNKDITGQKNLEKEMARLDRLNLIGQMAAGISHEVRNPMTTVRGFLQLLHGKESDQQKKEYYELMIGELDRANEIITEYLSVARPQSVDFRKQNLNAICFVLEPLLKAEALKIGKDIVFNLQEVPDLLLDSGEIRQLMLNLSRNGLEAMTEQGKTLTITTSVQGEEVVLSFHDEGSGISDEIIGKLGMPFLTTKENGVGLGLAVCYGIAARHQATIEAASDPEGTTFTVRFPIKPAILPFHP